MADERSVNGEISDGQPVEITGAEDSSRISGLTEKIDYLEHEYGKTVGENEDYKQQVEDLKVVIHDLRTDNEDLKVALQKLESDTKVLKEVAARAADLEAEVSRLQHDFVSATADLRESTTELFELKMELEIVSKREKEKDAKLEAVVNERDILSSRVAQLVASESALRDEIEAKWKEIQSLKKSIVELQGSVESSISLEKLKTELEKTIDNLKGDISTMENNLKEKENLINEDDSDKKGLIGCIGQKNLIIFGSSTFAAIAVMGVACYLHAAKKHH